MPKTRLSVFAALLTLFGAHTPGRAAAPAPQSKRNKVVELVRQADRMPLTKAWELLERILDLVDGEEMTEDRALAALQEASRGAGPIASLVIARCYLELDEDRVYAQKAIQQILPVLASGKDDHRRAAAKLLGRDDLGRSARRLAAGGLEKLVKNDAEPAELRLAAAKSLYRVGEARQTDRARRLLRSYLKSRDRKLRIEGALAMFEIGDTFESVARGILEEIEEEPSELGRLAKAYLARDRQQRQWDALERHLNQRRLRNGGNAGAARGDKRLALLQELLGMVRAAHIDGKKVSDKDFETYLIESAAKGMLKALDPFSSFLGSEEYARFAFDLNRDYGGIGAFVRIDEGIFMITRPIYSGPAYKAGLLSNDRILKVDGWETADQELDEIIRRLKGKPGSAVKISVYRSGWTEPQDITLTRAEIRVPSVNWELLPGNVGYVELVTFGANTTKELGAAIDDLKRRGMRGLVVDLRSNSGGYLRQARGVAEYFLDKGKLIVYTKSRIGSEERFFSRTPPQLQNMPITVLINGATASASEIVSGALQDHKRALILGKQSYGKGSVQNLFPVRTMPGEAFVDENRNGRWDSYEEYKDTNRNGKFDPGPRARLTIARYYLPSGRCLHKIKDKSGKIQNPDYGVVPDVEVDAQRLKTSELWKNAVIAELWTKRKLHAYVDEHYAKNQKLFQELAESDRGSYAKYPAFEDFYKKLDTKLSKDDVRRWIRVVMREKVSDARGKAWPGIRLIGDFQEDKQLQAGVASILSKLGEKIADIEAYKGTLKLDKDFEKKLRKRRVVKK